MVCPGRSSLPLYAVFALSSGCTGFVSATETDGTNGTDVSTSGPSTTDTPTSSGSTSSGEGSTSLDPSTSGGDASSSTSADGTSSSSSDAGSSSGNEGTTGETTQGSTSTGADPFCGDGTIDNGEACDDGKANSDTDPDACRTDCELAGCGDGVMDTDEACDDGEDNSDVDADACRTTCELAGCGDGVMDAGETCDDDNEADDDGCSALCAEELGFDCVSSPSVCGPASILVNGDFEDNSDGDPVANGNTFPSFFPGTALWFADLAALVTAEAGITPLDGVQMLRFDATASAAGGFTSCNIQQGVDLAAYGTLIAEGRVSMQASASFNRVDTAIDSEFRVGVFAYSGSELDGWTQLDATQGQVFADLDQGTWELVDITLELPVGTTFVLMSLDAVENNSNDTEAPEFLGHFADGADLRVIVAPPP